jgi:hypothetical protein
MAEENEKEMCRDSYNDYMVTKEEADDPISLEQIDINKVCTMRNNNTIVTYDCNIAYYMFIEQKMNNSLTREAIPPVQIEKIKLCKEFNDAFPTYKFNKDYIVSQLKKYFNDEKLTYKEILELRKWTSFDIDNEIFSFPKVNKYLEYRELAIKAIENDEKYSWAIRPSSIVDSIEKKAFIRIISFKNNDENIYHIPILHLWGHGYSVCYDIPRGVKLDDIDLNKLKLNWFPCFIDICNSLKKKYGIKKLVQITK